MKGNRFYLAIFLVVSFSMLVITSNSAAQMRPYKTKPGQAYPGKTLRYKGGQIEITSVSEAKVQLRKVGSPAIIFVDGQLIDRLTSGRLIDARGRPVNYRAVQVKVEPVSRTKAKVTITLLSKVTPGTYKLQLLAAKEKGKQVIDLPITRLKVEVKRASSRRAMQKLERDVYMREPVVIDRALFNSVVSEVFSGARFAANACGGRDAHRKTTTSIPNLLYKEDPLSRLYYELTDGEKERSEFYRKEKRLASDSIYRRSKIRVCVDNWGSQRWQGDIEKGKFRLRIPFDSGSVIKGRAIDIQWTGFNWREVRKWNTQSADDAFPNHYFDSLQLVVLLTLYVDTQGSISYKGVDVRWFNKSRWIFGAHTLDSKRHTRGDFVLDILETKSEAYKNQKMEEMRQRVKSVFANTEVNDKVTESLTSKVRTKYRIGAITGLEGRGSVITVKYQ